MNKLVRIALALTTVCTAPSLALAQGRRGGGGVGPMVGPSVGGGGGVGPRVGPSFGGGGGGGFNGGGGGRVGPTYVAPQQQYEPGRGRSGNYDPGPQRPTYYAPQQQQQPVYVQPRPQYQPQYVSPAPRYYGPQQQRGVYVQPQPMWRPYRMAPRAIIVGVAPPRPYADPRISSPGAGYVWIRGYWAWVGSQHMWIAGHWEQPPYGGASWVDPTWSQGGSGYAYAPGYWRRGDDYYVSDYNAAPVQQQQAVADPNQPQPARPIALGEPVNGTLQIGDNAMPDGTVADDYALDLAAGQTITVIVQGGVLMTDPNRAIDPFVHIFFNGTEIARDDDGAGGQDSLVTFTPQQSGTYAIRVSTADGGLQQGNYTLSTYQGAVQLQR